jgi:hypothetical protein
MTTYQGPLAHRMTVANELSSDIASAILTAKERFPQQLNELKEIVLKVHFTLQEMAEKERRSSRRHAHTRILRSVDDRSNG